MAKPDRTNTDSKAKINEFRFNRPFICDVFSDRSKSSSVAEFTSSTRVLLGFVGVRVVFNCTFCVGIGTNVDIAFYFLLSRYLRFYVWCV